MHYPDITLFRSLAARGNLIPVYREIMADMDTPVSAFRKIDDGRYSFLLESIEGGEKWARYTFLGSSPAVVIRSKGNTVEVLEAGNGMRQVETPDPLAFLKEYLQRYTPVEIEGFPAFSAERWGTWATTWSGISRTCRLGGPPLSTPTIPTLSSPTPW